MQSTYLDKMKSLPNLFKRTLKSDEKRAPFDPLSLINIGKLKAIQIKEKPDFKGLDSQMKAADGNLPVKLKQFSLIKNS